MSFKDITELEDEWCGCGRVFLHLQGGFYVLYDRSAFLFWKNVSSMKLTMRFVKSINREIVKLGFPKNSAGKWLYGHQVFNMSENVLYFDTDWTVDDEEYMVFLDTARMQTKAADRLTPTVSVIAGQPVFQVAKALIEPIRSFLHDNLGLVLHPDKVWLHRQEEGVPFLGYVVANGERKMSKRGCKSLAESVTDALCFEVNPYSVRATVNSYEGYVRHFDYGYRRWKDCIVKM